MAKTLLENFRDALIAADVNLRVPSKAGKAHPLWLEPRGGAPAPGEKEGAEDDGDLVASAFKMPGLAATPTSTPVTTTSRGRATRSGTTTSRSASGRCARPTPTAWRRN